MKKISKLLILCAVVGLTAGKAQAQVGISVRIGPPALPVYVQPPCPVDGYLWQPGYWAYDPADGYYWVPGAWVAPPDPGLLWTPSYWGWSGGLYIFHSGYWGPHVGFYGGIDYGFGYPGSGFYGGAWSGRSFRYNTAVFNVNRTVIHNTYVNRSFPRGGGSRVSYNGGRGGISRQPTASERSFSSEHHVAATHAQMEHQQNAGRDPGARFNSNHGRPTNVANHGGGEHGAPNAGHAPGGINHGGAPNAANHEAHAPNAVQNHGGNVGRPAIGGHPQANHAASAPHENHPMNNAPHMQQHASQPQQHANRMPSQPQQHTGGAMPGGQPHMGGGFGGGHPAGPPAGGGGHPMGGGGGMPHGGGGGHPMGGGGGHGGGGHHP